ncbi:MAG: hypothetical protein MK102_15095 [Fuerstiella sp.]|nr:hypothetical protein [Fuerstiella sp.]
MTNPEPDLYSLDWSKTALAFRGFGVSNLGRTAELWARDEYRVVLETALNTASHVCSEVAERTIDLVEFVRQERNPEVENYSAALSFVMAVEVAQLKILKELFGVDWTKSQLSCGYSLGELAALVTGGVFDLAEALRIPLLLSDDCVDLSHEVSLGVLFSQTHELPFGDVQRLCCLINAEGRGVIGISAQLTPNTFLLIGQHDTLDRFKIEIPKTLPKSTRLHRDSRRWPPIHTPILWERNVADRAGRLMHTMEGGFCEPVPPVLSLVTGELSYNDYNARDLLCRWIDHPILLWPAIEHMLTNNIETVIHIGPSPEIIPGTFRRVSDNVAGQMQSWPVRTVGRMVRHPWMASLLPSRATLLRAPLVRHINLEDWLLQQSPTASISGEFETTE